MRKISLALLTIFAFCQAPSLASSYREAPQITHTPKVDGTDLYAFRSYETGREGFITIIANYNPIQNTAGGPNFFTLDENALYDIKIDNDGDGKEDHSFRFQFSNNLIDDGPGQSLIVNNEKLSLPLINVDNFTAADQSNRARSSSYSIDYIRNKVAYQYGAVEDKPRKGKAVKATNNGSNSFAMPEDFIGSKSIADYASYADSFIHEISIPKCDTTGKVFVGQRKEGFQSSLSKIFDLINLDLENAVENSDTADHNITSIALELPIACLLNKDEQPILGIWTTASLPARQINRNRQALKKAVVGSKTYSQVSRLGNPLVNSLIIGLADKDQFNASLPKTDSNNFAKYFETPTLPSLIEDLTSYSAPTLFPRTDLQDIFLTGIEGLNQVNDKKTAEILRLNTSTDVVAAASQNRLGYLGGDNAGYPNGRRPGDDVVDIFLRIMMGALLDEDDAASKNIEFTDGVQMDATQFDDSFPYLLSPS